MPPPASNFILTRTITRLSSSPLQAVLFLHTAAQIGLYSHGMRRYDLHSYSLQSYGLHGYIQVDLLFAHCRTDWPIQPWSTPLRPTQLRPTEL